MIPIIFHYHGAVPAGRLGMTWQILNSMQEASFAWLRTRVARLGMLASARQFAELDRVFFRVSKISWGVLLAGGATLFGLLLIVERMVPRLADRLIEPLSLALLLIGLLFGHVSYSCWTYLHAHKRAPYLILSLLGPAATGALMLTLGKPYGILGVAVAVLLVHLLINFPVALIVWRRCRQQWHAA
jgi:O-antigen/teichoic acid export membrane protein